MRSTGRKRARVSYDDDDAAFEADLIMEQNPTKTTAGTSTAQPVVEKVLGRKFVIMPEDESIDEMFLIKWRGLSYIHASWEFRRDVERIDPQGKSKLKRFLVSPLPLSILGDPAKPEPLGEFTEDEDAEYYNPEYAQVHRILSCDTPNCVHAGCSTLADMESLTAEAAEGEVDVYYLVKWRGMQYSDSTWERWEDIKYNEAEVFEFWQRQRPPKMPFRSTPHPSLQSYQQLVDSPKFGVVEENESEEDDVRGLYLRDYQLEGVNWLLWNWWHKRPCILADEMGLGKTIQTVCFLHQLQHLPATQVSGPFLVVAPLSLIQQWQNEIGLWSPQMNCVVLHGSGQSRQLIIENEFYYQEPFTPKADVQTLRKKNICKFDILLTTYEIAMKEGKALAKIDWKVLIVDEAHRLKNQTSRLFESMQTIPRDQTLLLTGTPLQNRTEELWALLHFADRTKFASQEDFVARFGDLRDAADVAGLHSMLKPYLLRRVKEDVEKSLPPKEETIIEVALTTLQKQFYRAIYEKNTSFLFKGAKSNNQPSLMNVMMELRKCCNHPFLIKGVEERLISELPENERTDEVMHEKMVMCAGKMVLLDKLLPRLFAEGHKVLIFSQMVRVLNILEDYLRWKGYAFERLDGSTRASERHVAVERFCRPSLKRFIMLLSTKAGGLGLNLTSADTVIIFDSDWNPHNDIQAQARAHRIGQTKAVMVYRLLTRKTYEMHMFHRASLKLGLDRAVLAHARNEQELDDDGGGSIKDGLQAKEIDELLKRGAYDVFRDDDTEQTEFAEADIDAIMQRSAHKISYEGVTTNSISSSLGGFAKATFVSADEREDVDINDPDFWKKAVGLAEPAPGVDDPFLENLPMQRKRKQTQVFGDQTLSDQKELDEMLREVDEDGKESTETTGKSSSKKKTEAKPKEPKPSKPWGPHSRDRVLRALLQFGFGRWGRIKRESGASQRSLADVENFVRSYMMQCGLCAGESDSIKGDTEFVHEAIRAAQRVDEMVKRGEREPLVLPPMLLDEKFLSKLKVGGRKMLQKLDLLAKLNAMIGEAVEKIYQEDPSMERYPTLDEAIEDLPREKILAAIPLGSVRPAWTRPRSWWDVECDRQFVLGIFIHGYGRYNEVRDDTSFVFHIKLKDWTAPSVAAQVKVPPKSLPEVVVDEPPKVNVITGDTQTECSEEVIVSHFQTPCGREGKVYLPSFRYSEYKGVYSQPGSVKWMAQYGDEKSSNLIGTYDTEVEAALAYDEVARSKEGEGALVNFDPVNNGKRTIYEIDRARRPALPWHRASKFRGVRASGTKWTAQISYDGTNHHLGTFLSEIEAAMAYDCAARDHHGTSAISNFGGNAERILRSMSREIGVKVEFEWAPLEETEDQVVDGEGGAETKEGKAEESAAPMEEPAVNDVDGEDVAAESVSEPMEEAEAEGGNETQSTQAEGMNASEEEAMETPAQSPVKKDPAIGSVEMPSADSGGDVVDNKGADGEQSGRERKRSGSDDEDQDRDGDENGSDEDEKDDDKNDDKDDDDDSSSDDDADAMPDARVLNKLFAWLVSTEQARLTKAQQEQKHRANKKLRQLEAAEKREERAKLQIEEDRKQSVLLGEKGILSLGSEQFDADAKQFMSKKALLRRCEAVLRKPMGAPSGTSLAMESSVGDDSEFNGSGGNDAASEKDTSQVDSEEGKPEGTEMRISDEKVKRICSALLLFGAPFKDSKLPLSRREILPKLTILVEGSDISAAVQDNGEDGGDSKDPLGEDIECFTWAEFLSYAGVNISVDSMQHFYTNEWLPFCVAISKTQSFSNGFWIPNPYSQPSAHNIASKGLCALFILRQRHLRAMRFVLSKHLDELMVYLQSNASVYVDHTVPVWWCPWIHDVALMLGCVKHGYMALEQICRDVNLPFTTDHLLKHVKRTFLYGSAQRTPAAWNLFESVEEAEKWAQCAVMLFPDQNSLESRLAKILSDMTKHLPAKHMCRINLMDDLSDEGPSMATAAIPLAPLNKFIFDSSKRRRLHVLGNHTDM